MKNDDFADGGEKYFDTDAVGADGAEDGNYKNDGMTAGDVGGVPFRKSRNRWW